MVYAIKMNGDRVELSDTATTDEMFSGTPLEAEGKLPKWYKK